MAKRTDAAVKERLSFLRGGKRTERSEGVDFYDYNLLAVVVLLTCFGLVMLYSTSAYEASVDYGNDMRFFARQAAVSALSGETAAVFSRMTPSFDSMPQQPDKHAASMTAAVTTQRTRSTGVCLWLFFFMRFLLFFRRLLQFI